MKQSVQVRNKKINLDCEEMYMRLLAANGVKRVPLERVMSFENAPVPLSIFNEDGTMVNLISSTNLNNSLLDNLHYQLAMQSSLIEMPRFMHWHLASNAETTKFKFLALKFYNQIRI